MLHAMDSVLFDTIYFSFLYQSWTLNLDWDNECESTFVKYKTVLFKQKIRDIRASIGLLLGWILDISHEMQQDFLMLWFIW